MTKRQFEQSELWAILKPLIQEELTRYQMILWGEESTVEIYRAQGAVAVLNSFLAELPNKFPDEIVDGKPQEDIVRKVIRGAERNGR